MRDIHDDDGFWEGGCDNTGQQGQEHEPVKTLKLRSMGILPEPLALGIPGNSSCCTCRRIYIPFSAGAEHQPGAKVHVWSPYCQGQLIVHYMMCGTASTQFAHPFSYSQVKDPAHHHNPQSGPTQCLCTN